MFIKNNSENLDKSTDRVLIRVDATEKVALGHLKRCLSLSCKLREKGVPVTFLSAKDKFTETLIREMGFDHSYVDGETNSVNDFEFTIETAKKLSAKIAIIDSYEIDAVYRKRLMDSGLFVVSIDDIADKDIPSHMIVNGNLNAENLKYENTEMVSFCLGIKYLILGPDFWNLNEINNGNQFDNVLITMGGIDHYDLTSRIMAMLDSIDADFDITAIIGPYYQNVDSIRVEVSRMSKKADLVMSPPSLFPYMKKSSMAFSAGGQTLYELSVLGIPTIGVTLWENQATNVSELSKMGAIIGVVYSNESKFDNTLRESASRIILDKNERRRLSTVSSALADGKGAERSASAIIESFEKWSSKACFKKEKKWTI